MQHTDLAGVMFFARIFELIHEAYEEFLCQNNIGIAKILKEENYILPIGKTSAEYRMPLFLNDKIQILIKLKEHRENSFCLFYEITDSSEKIAVTAETLHICLDKKTRTKINIPASLLKALESLR